MTTTVAWPHLGFCCWCLTKATMPLPEPEINTAHRTGSSAEPERTLGQCPVMLAGFWKQISNVFEQPRVIGTLPVG